MAIDAIVAIPARLESERLPGKPLLDVCGKPLLWHTWQAGVCWVGQPQTYIVTDSRQISDVMAGHGASRILDLSHRYPSGSRRVFAAEGILRPSKALINLQCDEPQIRPGDLDALLRALWADRDADVATLVCPFGGDHERDNPSQVKAIVSRSGRALYFTRSRVVSAARHVGVYAFKRDRVPKLRACRRSRLADAEGLEQLEWLDNGLTITTAMIDHRPISVNTPADLAAFTKAIQGAGDGEEAAES